MNHKNQRILLATLLVTGYLVLAVGSAWHVPHGHENCQAHGPGVQTCPWCLAAVTLLILTVVFGVPTLAGMAAGFVALASDLQVSSLRPLGWASRAPPVS